MLDKISAQCILWYINQIHMDYKNRMATYKAEQIDIKRFNSLAWVLAWFSAMALILALLLR